MKIKIIAKNKTHLLELIEEEMDSNGDKCNLNHIDTTNIINMENLFEDSPFNGKIDQWNVSNVEDMSSMFKNSLFNKDISKWNVSKVKEMNYMFEDSKFNGDISNWNITNVQSMKSMFYCSQLTCDLSDWKPLQVLSWESTFVSSKMPRPYWYNMPFNSRNKAINLYYLAKNLDNNLPHHETLSQPKKMKI